MQKLVDGLHHFQSKIFSQKQRLFERLAQGQRPLALFITCSDSRIDPALLTQTAPGEILILRNAGGIVPPYETEAGGEAATIEYAISFLNVPDIVVCGHSHCGAMDVLLNPEKIDQLPAVRSWLRHADATRRIIADNYQHLTDPAARLTAAIEENVLGQIESLRSHPAVADALGRGVLTIHGWVYKFESGQVFSYDPGPGQFVPVDRPPVHARF